MRVMVTGATGLVGGHTARALLEVGHDVTALVRDSKRLEATMAALGTRVPDVVVGDMTDEGSVAEALEGADALVHCAAVVSLDRRNEERMLAANPAGLHAVVGGAVKRGLDPIIYTSSTSALFHPDAGRLTADSDVAEVQSGYGRSKSACEILARRYQTDGAPVVITYPAGILGPPAGDAFGETANGMAGFVASGIMPTRRAALSFIDVRDLANIHVALVQPGLGPRRIMCGGHLVTMEDLAHIFRELTGRRFPISPVPPAALRATGRAFDALRSVIPFDSPMTAEGMTLITRWEGTDDAQLQDLGIELRDPMETMAASLLAWRDAGLITQRHAGTLGRDQPEVVDAVT